MTKQSFFYNFTASRVSGYSKFNYGILSAESDDDKSLADEVLKNLKSKAKEEYPDADDINITAFNRV